MPDPSVALKEGWIVLGEGDEPARALPTGFKTVSGEIIQAMSPDGLRRVLIPLADGPGPEDLMSAGVKIRNTRIGQTGGTVDHLEVRCELPRLNDLFDDVAGEMISTVVENPEQPGPACIKVLDRWRALLRSVRGNRPSRSSIVGMIAEMLILERILKHDPQRRIDIWIGREGQRHDFRRGDRAIEVKATLATEGRSMTVHGAHQLEEPKGGTLDLIWTRFEHVPGGDLSVSGMISRLSGLGVPTDLIHSGLDERGLPPGTWPEEQFEQRELLGFRVTDKFPRITEQTFNTASMGAVSEVRYRVNLDHAPEPMDEAELEKAFSGIAGFND